jgi:hypothetical protein
MRLLGQAAQTKGIEMKKRETASREEMLGMAMSAWGLARTSTTRSQLMDAVQRALELLATRDWRQEKESSPLSLVLFALTMVDDAEACLVMLTSAFIESSLLSSISNDKFYDKMAEFVEDTLDYVQLMTQNSTCSAHPQ